MNAWPDVFAAGAAGFGLGLGLVVGVFVARTVRRYLDNGNGDKR